MITITVPIDDHTRQNYNFTLFDLNAVFVGSTIESKPVGKRVWRITKRWDKYSERESSMKEPELNEIVKVLARMEVQERVKVLTWSQWKPKDN